MILIISSQNDGSTSDVVFWLRSQKITFIRLNEDDVIREIIYRNNSIWLRTTTDKVVKLNDITSYWYRRGQLRFSIRNQNTAESPFPKNIVNGIKNFKIGEINKLLDYIYYYLDTIPKSLTSYSQIDPNKLFVLEQARSCGFLVPDTLVSTNKEELKEFIRRHRNCITKPINEIFFVNEEETSYRSLTVPVNLEDIDGIKLDSTFPTLIQQGIDKKLEIRVFYLLGVCYSMAIFSQNDTSTTSDFRNYIENDKTIWKFILKY